jgi:exodeoxyribonuclease VIII
MIERTTPPSGLVHGLAANKYHATACVSNSMLTDLKRSPAHCYALHMDPSRPPRTPRPWMLTGPLAHCAVLEPDAMAARYAVMPDDAPRRPTDAQWNAKNPNQSSQEAMAWWREFTETLGTREIVTAAQYATVHAQLEAVKRVPALVELLTKGESEVSAFWKDEATGLDCRARPDWLHPRGPKRVTALDLKTIADLSPETVARAIASYGYHRQAAHYSNGLIACGQVVEEFVFGFVSGTYPYLAAAFVLDTETMQQGQDEVSELLELYANCERANKWPAFGDSYQLVGLPAWARRSAEVEVGFA